MLQSIVFYVTLGKWRAKDAFNDMHEGKDKSKPLILIGFDPVSRIPYLCFPGGWRNWQTRRI